MKIKNKNRESMIEGVKTIFSKSENVMPCLFAMDANGNLIIESFKKLLDYTDKRITISTANKQMYINGEELKILSCSKYNISINGQINSIEIFEVI